MTLELNGFHRLPQLKGGVALKGKADERVTWFELWSVLEMMTANESIKLALLDSWKETLNGEFDSRRDENQSGFPAA